MKLQYVYHPYMLGFAGREYLSDVFHGGQELARLAPEADDPNGWRRPGCWWKMVYVGGNNRVRMYKNIYLDMNSFIVVDGRVYLYRDFGKLAAEIERIKLEKVLEEL